MAYSIYTHAMKILTSKILYTDLLAGPCQTDNVPSRPRNSKLKKMMEQNYKMFLCLAWIKKTLLTCLLSSSEFLGTLGLITRESYLGKGLSSSIPGANENESVWCCSRCSCAPKPISHLIALLDEIGLCMLSGHSNLVHRINPFWSSTQFYWQKTGKQRSEEAGSEIGVKHLHLQVSPASRWWTRKESVHS